MKMMAPPTTATTDSRLRLRGYYHNHRALHGEQQSLFDNPGSSQIDDTFNQNSQQQPPLSLQRHSVSWGTYASFFLLTQGIAIICIIGILIFCIRKHRHQMTRQRIASMAQLQVQGWVTMTTMRSSTTPTAAAAAVGEIVDVGGGGQTSGNERADNDARDIASGLGAGGNNDISSSLATGDDQICPYPPNNGVNNDRSEHHPTPFDRFLTMSRTIGSTMLYPLRALRAAINDWATGSYDEVFLRQLMERMEAEREAAKENPKERARRLKEAFVKAGTVWELGDEHFIPPTRIGQGFTSSIPIPNRAKLDIEEGMKAEEVKETYCEVSLVDEIYENDVLDVQTRDQQLDISPRHGKATEMNSNIDCLESSIDSLEPNQRYIYLFRSVRGTMMPMNAESTECIPIIVHEIPNQCAICLCDYENGETIVTSFNGECPHAFHQECVIEWLVKMQEDAPCPCCRRTFIDLDSCNPCQNNDNIPSTTSNNATNTSQDLNESGRHHERRRWRMSFGVQSSTNSSSHDSVQELTEAERLRQEWVRHIIEQELRRRRAFNASVISLR